MSSKQAATSRIPRSISTTFFCFLLFSLCSLEASAVCAQPGSRAIIKTHPREITRRIPLKPSTKKVALPSTISLWIVSNPPNSKVFVNGEARGETDTAGELELKLTPGSYTIRLTRDGYLARDADVNVPASPEAQQVEFILPNALVTLNVVTDPPGTEIYFDDVYKGATGPNGLLVLEKLTANQPHVLRVRKEGYVQQSTPVTANTGQIAIKLLADSLQLKVVTDPPEAEVYLDEVYKGTSTSDGTLMVAQVNPNQSHTVRAKKDGYRQQSTPLPPGTTEAPIKLAPDPVVILIRQTKLQVAENRIPEAVLSFNQLLQDAPEHQELPRISESILLALQSRTAELLKRVEPFDLTTDFSVTEEMNNLYLRTRAWRPGDEAIENLGKYWRVRFALLSAERSQVLAEKETLQGSARIPLLELSERNLRNPYLALQLGWSWWKLKERVAAQKQFLAAQELKPDWAYPYFALGFLSLDAATNERSKSAKVSHYTQALENFTRAITLKHDFATAYALKSLIYGQLKKEEESLATGLQAVAVDPQNAYAHFALGSAYFEKGKSGYRNALAEFNRAIALGGNELDGVPRSSIQLRLTRIKQTLK